MDIGLKNSFFSFHITDNVQVRAFYPKAFFSLLKDVRSGNTDLAGSRYELNQLGINGVHYRTFGVGYRYGINEYISVGAKVKYIQGLSSIRSKNNGLAFNVGAGSTQFNIENDINFLYTGLAFLGKDSLSLKDYFVGNSNGNNGFAFDIGLNLRLNDQLEFFVTAIDIGGLTMKNRVQEFTLNNSSVNLSANNLDDFEQELGDTFDEAFLSEELTDTTFNIGLTSQAFVGGLIDLKNIIQLVWSQILNLRMAALILEAQLL